MKSIIDVDSILFKILNSDKALKAELKGGIYTGDDRPEGSEVEDIVVNTIAITQDYLPQLGTSNVNIFVPDIKVRINGKEQIVSNRARINELAKLVTEVLKSARVYGLLYIIENQSIIDQPTIKQHFLNIRLSWNIQVN